MSLTTIIEQSQRKLDHRERQREQIWARYWRIYKIRHPLKYAYLRLVEMLGYSYPLNSAQFRWNWTGNKGLLYRSRHGEVRIATNKYQGLGGDFSPIIEGDGK